jgi:hypothetical protein
MLLPLVETRTDSKQYIVGGSRKPRHKTKLWLFNCIFMILPYTIFVIMNFIWYASSSLYILKPN